MSLFRAVPAVQELPDRRLRDRRHLTDVAIVHPPIARKRPTILLSTGLIALSVLIWQWRAVVYTPLWLARSHWADRSDIYLGRINGIDNLRLVQQARNYLADIDHLDASGNVTAPAELRPVGAHLDLAWFQHHAPDSVDVDPFSASGGKFVVSWLYFPGCQKTVWKSPSTDTDWYSLRGRPCFPVCRIFVVMTPDLRLSSIAFKTPQY